MGYNKQGGSILEEKVNVSNDLWMLKVNKAQCHGLTKGRQPLK